MAKEIDPNGYWYIKGNPLTKEGVFSYSGCQIDQTGKLGLEPDRLYNVYRPASELTSAETIKSFNGVPLINDHEMIGDGCTDYDSRPAGGVLFNVDRGTDMAALFGDFKIYSESLKNEITNGKKELSLGYRCKYEPSRGVFGGKTYDFVQRDIIGNHIALVDKGRMGSDIRVYDSKAMVFDSITDVNPAEKGIPTMTDEEKKAKEAEEAAAAQKAQDEATAAEEAKKAQEAQMAADAEAEELKKKEAEQKAADEAAEEEARQKAEKEKEASAMDSAISAALQIVAARKALEAQVEPLIGTCDSATWTVNQYAEYACSKLKLGEVKGAVAHAKLEGFLVGNANKSHAFSMDAAPSGDGKSRLEKYLKEGK